MPELASSEGFYPSTYPSLFRGRRMADEPQKGLFLTPQEAADLLGVSRETIRRAIRSGELKATRLGYRTVRVTRADLDEWVVSKGGRPIFGTIPAPKAPPDEEK
jgi:excisionase family DNA binding protein